MEALTWRIDKQQVLQDGKLAGWQLRTCFPHQQPDSELWAVVQQALDGAVASGHFFRGGERWRVVARPDPVGARGVCARGSAAPLSPEPLLTAYSAQGRAIRALAHNINNQLGAICNYTALLRHQHDGELPREISAIEGLAFKASDQLSALRILSSGQPLHTAPLDTSRWLQDFVGGARAVYADRNIVLDDQGGALIPANTEALRAALQAALQNAVEATQPGDQIRISASVGQLDAPDLAGWPAQPGRYWSLRIIDSGEGIPAERLEEALELFEGTRSPSRGLGLPTVFSVARHHGGRAQLHSAPGAGTELLLSLPLASPHSTQQAVPVPLPDMGPPRTGKTLLLADDNVGVLMITGKTLRRAGYTVVEARDGNEAMSLFQAEPDRFDAALLDARMPGRSGTALAAAMRALHPQLRVLLITGGQPTNNCPYPVLSKPYRPNQLLKMVHALLQ